MSVFSAPSHARNDEEAKEMVNDAFIRVFDKIG